jgi:hypothetical protein
MSDVSNNNNGSTGQGFGLGLLIGGLAGISAYYLFGTEEGNRLKKKLVEEFEYARVTIPREIGEILAEADVVTRNLPATTLPEGSKGQKQGLWSAIMGKREPGLSSQPVTMVKKKPKNVFYKSGKKIG